MAIPSRPSDASMKHYARSRAWCEWDDFDAWQLRAMQALSDPDVAALSPFHLLSLPGITAAQQQACATRWMADRLLASAVDRALLSAEFAAGSVALALQTAAPHDRIRIGYLSCDFHQHATALLMVEMLEAHDLDRFELHAYSYGADDGLGMRQRLTRPFERFNDITDLDDLQAARADQHKAETSQLEQGYTQLASSRPSN